MDIWVPAYTALGSKAPKEYLGYYDDERAEVYGYSDRTGECCYGVGADGDVFDVDFRSVLWVPVAKMHPICKGRKEKGSRRGLTKDDAVGLLQSVYRRRRDWERGVTETMKQYVKRWDASSGFYYYERRLTGETQWHRPVVLLGTRRRRGLDPAQCDVPEDQKHHHQVQHYLQQTHDLRADCDYYHAHDYVDDFKTPEDDYDEKADDDYLRGPYCCRLGKGKQARFAIHSAVGGAQNNEALKQPISSVDETLPLFLTNHDIDTVHWKPGDVVQCYDGLEVKRVKVDPYVLARGACARGPMDIVKVMQRHGKRLDVVYFCLMAIAKTEFSEADDGRCTREAKACILQTLKTFHRHSNVTAIAAGCLAALASLAENYACRLVIAAEDWCKLTSHAMQNLDFQTQEIIVPSEDGLGNTKRFIKAPTSQSTDVAIAGCRLFGAMANDLKMREAYAEDAITSCIAVMTDCEHDANVQTSACRTLFNVVFRCEAASIVADDANVSDLVDHAIDNFFSDHEFMAVADRTRKALLPGGWRGGFADDEALAGFS